ncbi:MAG: hypothetical protein PHE84_10335 [bacterium]|nr:hypothetical protein [bacterium]
MEKISRMSRLRRLILFAGVSTLFFGIYPPDARPADSPGPVPEKKSLTRVQDYVLARGKILKNNLGKDIGQMGLLAFHKGKLEPIPFQIDEMNPEGDWVLTQVPPELKNTGLKPEKDDDDGSLDANDELAFMARDAGDRVKKESLPPGILAADEIMIRDPVDGTKAWVYLCSFSGSPLLSDRDYVEYVFPEGIPGGRIRNPNFEIGFSPELPIAPGFLSIHGSHNIIDRMKTRLQTKLIGMKFSLDETQLVSKTSLYKDGPIRVIRRTRSAVKLIGIFRTPSAAVENIYYENVSIIPFRVKMLFSIKAINKLIGYVKIRGTLDFQNIHGWRIKTDAGPDCWLNIDGKMDEAEKNVNGKNVTWFLVSGPPGAFMIRLVTNRMPDGSPQEAPLISRLFYLDDDLSLDPPEAVPGQSPGIGYWLDGTENLEKGIIYLYAISYTINDYYDGKEKEYMNILDKPLEVSVEAGN